ncbi:SOUL heme-binding protein [Dinoroseobacter shibae DFL 12 = DSM 16493]|uniref:SOUL heme-binding protein n=2 Tax=Dinoroseobacter shibae TaxID=215813 RepID=A8LKJ2_DINSH|nr:heme-binding protein [Dinoroseobacter sp. PD6]ABV91835.1 SOUL heme-binding protein [Dinoroseobacter shibae DFL 12 = DSM 16493]MDD9717225.1 heme-binding protein [Dinoroseobacter sp. PD6]
MIRTTHIALMLGMMVAAVSVGAEAQLYRGYETPSYEVTVKKGDFERRSYAPQVVAEVYVQGDREEAVSRGFRVLADYIFGGNVDEAKVAMTTPVSQQAADDDDAGLWVVRFGMPRGYTLENLPKPQSAAIRLTETPAEDQLVVQFTGRWSEAQLTQKELELRAFAAAHGLDASGAPRFYFYDGPFTLPWTRRNEVALVLN